MITTGDNINEVINPITNQIFINRTNNYMVRYDGTEWVSMGGSTEIDTALGLKANIDNPRFTGNATMDGGYIKQWF
jgi:hypothetical protein